MCPAPLNRRELLDLAACSGLALAGSALLPAPLEALLGGDLPRGLAVLAREAPVGRFWTPLASLACADCHATAELARDRKPKHPAGLLQCQLCAHRCVLAEGERGRCRVRLNIGGELRSLSYGRPLAEHVDPIEKKPFFHFLPGGVAYSLGTAGCPLRCRFCQNWEISQANPEDDAVERRTPAATVERARGAKTPIVAFTYNEPTVFVEYLLDVAHAARERGLRAVLVSCGYMNEAPLAEMIAALDAIKIDLKGFTPEFYRDVSGAELQPVLRSIRQVARAGRHLELVNLVVPTLNDSERALSELAAWVAGELGPDVPVHFTRFHPDYQLLNLPPTPVETLERAREFAIARGQRYVYIGNVPGHPGSHTYCPGCGQIVIERSGIFTTAIRMRSGACAACGTKIAGVWS